MVPWNDHYSWYRPRTSALTSMERSINQEAFLPRTTCFPSSNGLVRRARRILSCFNRSTVCSLFDSLMWCWRDSSFPERKADYIVYARTISSELKGPDRTIKLIVQGTKGKQEMLLENPVTMQNTFQPGRKDEYYIENVKSMGDLQTMEVDISHPHIKRLGLDYIEINDPSTNQSYR